NICSITRSPNPFPAKSGCGRRPTASVISTSSRSRRLRNRARRLNGGRRIRLTDDALLRILARMKYPSTPLKFKRTGEVVSKLGPLEREVMELIWRAAREGGGER